MDEQIECLVALNGIDRVLNALVRVCDPTKHESAVRKLNPGLEHQYRVLKAASLALSDSRFEVRVEVRQR